MTCDFPSLEQARSELADAVIERGQDFPSFEPMNIHPWLAMSLMQKAIRRGRTDLALGASATLLKASPDRFWRRLGITAYEDIGVADVETVAIVTASLKGKRWRSQIGDEWAVASTLVERMSRTAKCRAADDLAVVCQWHPSLKHVRSQFPKCSISELFNTETNNQGLSERALALWYAIGTDRCRSPVLPERTGDPSAVWDALSSSCFPANAIDVAQEGFRKTNSILCPFALLLWPKASGAAYQITPDDLPDEEMIGDVPCWAFDVHVREGTQAIARFLRTDCETAKWIVRHTPRHERFRVAGSMLFRVESGKVDHRLHWETGDELLHMADLETGGIAASVMREGLQLLLRDLPKLNRERHYAWSNAPKNEQLSFSGPTLA